VLIFVSVKQRAEDAVEELSVNDAPDSAFFAPSIYAGIKTAGTEVKSQYEKAPTGAVKIKAENTGAAAIYIGLGKSIKRAEAAAVSGEPGLNRFIIMPGSILLKPLFAHKFAAWGTLSGSSTMFLEFGV